MMKFINRKDELGFLEKKHSSEEAELIVLYGRRRIGKTELLVRFCEGKNVLYFLGRLEARDDTLRRFNSLLSETFGDSRLLSVPLREWDSIFDYIAEQAKDRVVIIFDEFPFIIKRFPEIVSVLQDKWDSSLKNSKVMVVLSGSSIGMMEKYALEYKSPLYGRRTGQWKVGKLCVKHLKDFFPAYRIEELISLYSCLDTIPGYLVKFSPDKTVGENIKERIFSKGEFLFEEIEILLREEFRDPSNYMSILSAISGGAVTFNEIYTKTGLDKSLLSRYIFTLESLGIVKKMLPVAGSHKAKLKAKGALYFLADNFFDFWFRFVYLNKQELEKGDVEGVFVQFKRDEKAYMGRKFEQFVLELLPLMKIGSFSSAGRWWHKDKEIDIVALNEADKKILFAECKWADKVDASKVTKGLAEKTGFVQWNNESRKEIFAIFAKSFSKKISEFGGKKVHCFAIVDMEKVMKNEN